MTVRREWYVESPRDMRRNASMLGLDARSLLQRDTRSPYTALPASLARTSWLRPPQTGQSLEGTPLRRSAGRSGGSLLPAP